MVEWRRIHINAILFLNFLEVSKKKKCRNITSSKKKPKKLLFFPDSVNILLLTSRDVVNQLVFNLERAV